MCETAADLVASLADFVAAFEPATYTSAQLDLVVKRAIKAQKMLGYVVSVAAAHLASCGDKDHAEQVKRDLAFVSGSSRKEAERMVGAGRLFSKSPDVGRAAQEGKLSAPQLAVIAESAGDDPDTAANLAKLAESRSLKEFAEEAGRLRAARLDPEARRKAIHAGRFLRQHTASDGAWYLHARGTPEDGAKVMAAISAFSDRAFEIARKEDRHETAEAYAFDGLVGLAGSGGSGKGKTSILVRLDHSALVRGYALDGEVCEIDGFGPTTVQAVRDMVQTGDPFLKAIVQKGQYVVGVAHLGRKPTSAQMSALDWLYPRCAAEGCGTSTAYLETDHREDWARTHYTVFNLLDRLCPHHHRLKTHKGWMLVDGVGKRPFVPPDDQRHPRQRGNRPESTGAPGSFGGSHTGSAPLDLSNCAAVQVAVPLPGPRTSQSGARKDVPDQAATVDQVATTGALLKARDQLTGGDVAASVAAGVAVGGTTFAGGRAKATAQSAHSPTVAQEPLRFEVIDGFDGFDMPIEGALNFGAPSP